MSMILSRRNFFGLLAAPAIIRVADMMAVKALILGALALPWGVKLLHDGQGWKVDEGGIMVPVAGRELLLGGQPLKPEYLVEMSNYAQAGNTMHIRGSNLVEMGHVGLLDQYGHSLRR